jgi:predicted porin
MNLKVMSGALLLSAALYGGYSGPAFAADLGGDCCADLEERVAELEATTARKGNRKVSLSISGQVNTALMFFDTEKRSDFYVVDNQNSNSRFRFNGDAKISPTLSAGFLIEVAAGLTAESSAVTEANDDGSTPGDGNVQIRHANWYLNHTQLGRLTVGRGSMATDGISEIDLVGVNVVSLPGIYVGNKLSVGGASFDTVATGNYEFDRNNMIRYDTPTIAGFQGSAAFGEDDRWDVTLRYAGEHHGFRVAAGIGYGVDTDEQPFANASDERRILAGSVSALHVASGLFANVSYAKRTNELIAGGSDDETYWGVRAGVAKNWFGIGNTVLFGEYNHWDNGFVFTSVAGPPVVFTRRADNEATAWGLAIIQNVDAAALELYLSYKNLSVDNPVVDNVNEDAHVVLSGARIKF